MTSFLLAFDTSTEAMALALHGRAGTRLWNGPGGPLASAQLLPRIMAMLEAQETKVHELGAIAFGCGPGAFTGLRTAAAVAQGLALGAGLTVLPVDSLLIVAEDAHAQCKVQDDVGVVMDARMDQFYAARYRRQGEDWLTTMPPSLFDPQSLRLAWLDAPPALLAGNGVAMFVDGKPRAKVCPAEQDRAAALLRLAQRMQGQGRGVDAAQALPLYLRDKVALTTRERMRAAS